MITLCLQNVLTGLEGVKFILTQIQFIYFLLSPYPIWAPYGVLP